MRAHFLLIVTLTALLLRPLPALAHGAYIFAWVDGDSVCTESYFDKKHKIRGGIVTARSAAGRTLAEGRTDERGRWCFPAPPVRELHFVVNAGQGHRAEFVLPVKNFPAADEETPPVPPVMAPDALRGLVRQLLRETLREELQTQLSPIHQALAERNADGGPALPGIAGGLGWIVGLAGLAAWYNGTRRKK